MAGEHMDRERDWLLKQRDDGLRHREIAETVRVERSTITRILQKLDYGGDLSPRLRTRIATHLDWLEREEEERRQAIIDQEEERKRAEEIERRRRQMERIKKAKRVAATKRLNTLKQSLLALERLRLKELREVNGCVEAAGIDTGGRIHGDGLLYARTLQKFHYADPGAERVGFVPDSYRFPCGWTGSELREGVSAEQRRSASFVPTGRERPEFIGMRPGTLVNAVPYPDERWFWGEYSELIDEWRHLIKRKPAWWEEGSLPMLPEFGDLTWYDRILEVETDLLSEGLRFERSVIDWGDDWQRGVDGARAVLGEVERRVRRRDVLEKLAVGAYSLVWVTFAMAAVVLVYLAWDLFLWNVLRWSGGLLLAIGTGIVKALVWILKGLWWLIKGIVMSPFAAWREGVTIYDEVSQLPHLPLFLAVVAAAAVMVCLKFAGEPSRSRRHNSTRPWFIVGAAFGAVLMFAGLFYWVFSAPSPEVGRLFLSP